MGLRSIWIKRGWRRFWKSKKGRVWKGGEGEELWGREEILGEVAGEKSLTNTTHPLFSTEIF
jgi:hypothetical protein